MFENKSIIIRSVFLVILVVLSLFLGFLNRSYTTATQTEINDLWTMHYENTEQIYREKARNMLSQSKYCIEKLTGEETNISSNEELFSVIDTCIGNAKTTTTGDAFAFRTTDYMFIYDPSLDCFVAGGKKFYDKHTSDSIMDIRKNWDKLTTKEKCREYNSIVSNDNDIDCTDNDVALNDLKFPECYLHSKPDMCFEARRVLTSGYDSKMGNDTGWVFDNSEEWLEWVILPEENKGFKGWQRGHESKKPNQVVLVLGVQSDEVINREVINKYFEKVIIDLESRYEDIKMLIQIIMFVSVVFSLFGIAFDQRRKDIDCPFDEENCLLVKKRKKDSNDKSI